MGEAKTKAKNKTPYEREMEDLLRDLANKGRLIEAGWIGLRKQWIAPNASKEQVQDLRWAFMAGAQHLWASIMMTMDPGAEETPEDMRRMDLINQELETFRAEAESKLPTRGPMQ